MVLEGNFLFVHYNKMAPHNKKTDKHNSNSSMASHETDSLLPIHAKQRSPGGLVREENRRNQRDNSRANPTTNGDPTDLRPLRTSCSQACQVYGTVLCLLVICAVVSWRSFVEHHGIANHAASTGLVQQHNESSPQLNHPVRDKNDEADNLEWWEVPETVPTYMVNVSDDYAAMNTASSSSSSSSSNMRPAAVSNKTNPNHLRWGILGCGRIAHDFTTALKMEGATITAVAAGSLPQTTERAAAFASLYDIPQSYGSYQGLADDPQVDIVYVATTNQLHYNNTMMLLQSGKNVLLEKPMAVTLREAQGMIAAAQQHQRLLLTNYWTRFFPVVRQYARSKVQVSPSNKPSAMGSIMAMHGDLAFVADPSSVGAQRLLYPNLGGGAMLDLGCYLVNLAVWVASAQNATSLLPSQVEAVMQNTIGAKAFAVDTEVAFTLKWGGDNSMNLVHQTMDDPIATSGDAPFSAIFSGQASFRRPSSFQVEFTGSHGRLVLRRPANAPTKATLYEYGNGGGPIASIAHVEESPSPRAFDTSYYPEQYPGATGFVHVIRAIAACMKTKGIPGRPMVQPRNGGHDAGGCLELEELSLVEQMAIANITDRVLKEIGYFDL